MAQRHDLALVGCEGIEGSHEGRVHGEHAGGELPARYHPKRHGLFDPSDHPRHIRRGGRLGSPCRVGERDAKPKGALITRIADLIAKAPKDDGEIRILGSPLSQDGLDRIGYLPEERGVYRRMKVRKLLAFFAELKGVSPRDSKPRRCRRMRASNGRRSVTRWRSRPSPGRSAAKCARPVRPPRACTAPSTGPPFRTDPRRLVP